MQRAIDTVPCFARAQEEVVSRLEDSLAAVQKLRGGACLRFWEMWSATSWPMLSPSTSWIMRQRSQHSRQARWAPYQVCSIVSYCRCMSATWQLMCCEGWGEIVTSSSEGALLCHQIASAMLLAHGNASVLA